MIAQQQAQRLAAREHPAVRAAIEILDAEVRDIRLPTNSRPDTP